MERKPVKSSNVKSIGFEHGVVGVEFHGGKKPDSLYHYHGVPASVYAEFEKAPSKGKFVKEHLVGKYRTERIR